MKLIFLFLILVISSGMTPNSDAQLLEMAANCDQAMKKLSDIIKSDDGTSGLKIKQAIGVDSLVECDSPEGKYTCFQCLDDDKQLRLIQILQKEPNGRFESLGFGCRCKASR